MNKALKTILTIPAILSLIYMTTYIFPTSFPWIIQNENIYYFPEIINSVSAIISIILVWRLWKFKNILNDTKWLWTFFLLMFNSLAIVIYLWFFEEKYETTNKKINPR